MKVALIHNLYGKYSRGGAEQIVKKIAQGLAAQGNSVFIISGQPFSSWRSLNFSSDIEDNIKVYRFYPLNIYFYSQAGKHNALTRMIWTLFDLFNFWSVLQVKKILQAERPDIVWLHNLKGLGYLIPRAAKKLNAKIFLTLHDVQLVNPSGLIIKGAENSWLNTFILAKAYQALCRYLFRGIDQVISPSKFLLDFYLRKGFFKEGKKIVLPNPAILDVKEVAVARASRQTHLPVRLLFVGQIEKHKGINWLLNFLKNEGFQVLGKALIVTAVGEGREKENLQKMHPQISWLGRIEREKLKEVFANSDFLIFPSLCYENSPTVIYEALSVGLPVIASSIGGVPELVKANENGLLFEPGNSRELKKALEQAVSMSSEQYLALSDQAIKSVQLYNVDNYLNLYLKT